MPEEPNKTAELSSLAAAFAAFNQVSGCLQDSYADLQKQVQRLEAQLDAANRRNATEARRNAELASRLAALLEALPGGVIMLDGDGMVRELNATATDFLGAPLQDTAWSEVRQRAFEGADGDEGDVTLRDGRTLSLAQRLLEPGPSRVLLFTDVTEHRKVQQLLSRHRRLAAMGEMAAALAHQIRTPLSAALLYVDNAARPDLAPEKRQEMLSKSTRCLHDLEQLIADMLQFARGAHTAETAVEISDMLEGVRNALEGIAGEHQQLTFTGSHAGIRLTGNREALTGAILNLATNALQHGGNNARVTIDLRRNGTDLEIRVKDDGPGVPAANRARIFDPFFTSRPDGTGLGLAVVRSVARAHGGDATLEENQLPGACFLLRLPVSRNTTEEIAA